MEVKIKDNRFNMLIVSKLSIWYNSLRIIIIMRHDIDHGGELCVRKKHMSIGECYNHYCKKRPIQVKDFRLLQQKIYDEILELTEYLIVTVNNS